jgi:hypothetical protein
MSALSSAHRQLSRALEMRRLQRNHAIAYLYLKLAALRVVHALKARYDPAQARDGGGRWTRIGGAAGTPGFGIGGTGDAGGGDNGDNGEGGAGGPDAASEPVVEYGGPDDSWSAVATTYDANGVVAAQVVANRDGSSIQSEFDRSDARLGFDERHTVVTTDGNRIAFETSGGTQTIADATTGDVLGQSTWTENGPVSAPGVQHVFDPGGGAIVAGITAGIVLYNWMSARNDDSGAAVLAFKANEYGPGEEPKLDVAWVGRVTRDQVDAACPRHGEVQDRTDAAAIQAQREGNYVTAQQYGNEVHKLLEYDINRLLDKDLRAEVAVSKSELTETGRVKHIRVDVLENVGNGTVCVYDIKTGDRGLSQPRSMEIAREVYRNYKGIVRIVVIETRPRR